MSADIANTTLASAPYYDDFDETKKFHRVLFRPSFPVQARELTQLQSILQNQIERFGDGVFKQGSIIKGCAPTVIPDAVYVAVPDKSNTFAASNTSYVGAILYGANSGVQARILKGQDGFASSSDPSKLFVKYTSTGKNGVTDFQEGETITIYGEDKSYLATSIITVANATNFAVNSRVRGETSDARGLITAANTTTNEITITNVRKDFAVGETIQLLSNTLVNTAISNVQINFTNSLGNTTILTTPVDRRYIAVGNAYALSVSEGIVYQKGFFVKTDTQLLILNDSAGGPAAANGIIVGMETTETVVDEFADSSLYDNSADLSNDAAPGAHRLKLETNFVSYDKTALPNTDVFFAVAEFGSNNILKWNNNAIGGAVGQEMAQRTYDESGHYTLKDFTITSKPSANTQEFYYDIGAGKAYVRGNAVDFKSNQVLTSRRGVDTESPVQQIVSMNYGSYITVEELRGYFPADQSALVNLYDSFQNAITASLNSSSSATGNVIGTANIRNLVYDTDSADKGAPLAQYKMYLFNVKMNENKSFNKVRSIVYQGTANAFSDVAVSQLANSVYTATISANGGGYTNGDIITVSGGLGTSATALLTVNNASGNVTSISLIQGGKYTANPTLTGAAVTGGSGTGLTVNLTIDGYVDPKLEATDYTALVFGLTNRAVRDLKNAEGDSDTEFYYNASIDASLANNGTTTISLTDGGSFFGFSDNTDFSEEKVDIVLTESALTTVNLSGNVNVANSTTTVVTGNGTAFSNDFVVGEKITIAGNTAVIVNSIANSTYMTTRTAHGAAASGNTYARFHEKGSIISLATSNRTITLNSTLQSLTVDLGPNFTASGATGIKVNAYARKSNARPIAKEVKRNQLVRFYNGTLTGTIASSGNTVTGTSTTFDADIKVGNYIRANGQTRKVTVKSSNTSLQVDTAFTTNLSGNTYEIVHPYGFNLGVPDVFKINAIRKTADAVSDSPQAYSDMKKYFTYDFGQRDTHYDHAVLYSKSTANISNSYLIVDFDCFAANATLGKGFFSVESYSVNDAIGANTSQYIKTWEIPSYYSATRDRRFDLRDSIDFRPYRANTANLTSNASATTINPPRAEDFFSAANTFNLATTDYNPYPGQNFECNLTYYLPRRDAVVLTSKGNFEVVEGESSLQPRTPNAESDDQMVIATTYIPPYPSLTVAESQYVINQPYTMTISPVVNKRYRMKDIGAIDQRVSSLEYYTTLTRLEQKATQLNIPDENGVDRFKNGFFVDPLDNNSLSRFNDYEHTVIIDEVAGVARPPASVETVSIEVNSPNSNSSAVIKNTANNISFNKNFITVAYDNIKFASQDYSTREILIDPDDKYQNGVVELDKDRFADVEQSIAYPKTLNVNETTNYNNSYIFPAARTIKLIARGLKPFTRHYISVDNVDYSAAAIPGDIAYGVQKVASNVIVDGVQGEELYSDSTGVLYAIATIPGNLSLGNHVLSVTDAVAPAVPESISSGAFVVALVEQVSEPPVVEPPLVPKTPLIVADFDYVGNLVEQEGTDHILSFIDKTNRGVVAVEGTEIEAPSTWEWTFVHCSTGCVEASRTTANTQNVDDITFTYPTMIETVYVKLKVTGVNGTVSEVVKPIQLTKYEEKSDLKLTVYYHVPGDNNNYYISSGSTAKVIKNITLDFRATMTNNRVSGGYVEIAIVGNQSGNLSGTKFTATNIGSTASIESNSTLPFFGNADRTVSIRWTDPLSTTLTITATYYTSAGVVVESVQKTISFNNTGSLAPCKPCDPAQLFTPTIVQNPISVSTGVSNSSVTYVSLDTILFVDTSRLLN